MNTLVGQTTTANQALEATPVSFAASSCRGSGNNWGQTTVSRWVRLSAMGRKGPSPVRWAKRKLPEYNGCGADQSLLCSPLL